MACCVTYTTEKLKASLERSADVKVADNPLGLAGGESEVNGVDEVGVVHDVVEFRDVVLSSHTNVKCVVHDLGRTSLFISQFAF